MKLDNKVAIITGAASGIGREIALGFSREGATVVIFDVNIDGAKEVAQQIKAEAGTPVLALQVDVGNSAQVNEAVRKTKDVFDRIDILVNNAAYLKLLPFVEISERDWDEIIRVSLKGYFLCGQATAKEMIRRKSGKIINIGSLTGHLGFAGGAVYGTAKGGIIALTRTLAVELAQHHIQVNAISPGPTLTPMFEKVPPKDKEARLERIPAGRFGKPEDFVGPAVFFASDDSNYVFGQILIVDGGLSAAGVFKLYGY